MRNAAANRIPVKFSGRGYAIVCLCNPKNTINVGSALRAAGCYGAAAVYCAGSRNKYRRAPSDTQKAYRHIPLLCIPDAHDCIPYDCVPVAVEIVPGARSLFTYTHPERAVYVFGPEDGTLGTATLEWCRDVVYVPTRYCMNLAATVNVVLYDRARKQTERE